MGVAPYAFREVVAVGFPERVDPRVAVFFTNLSVLIPAAIIEAVIAMFWHVFVLSVNYL